MNENFWPPIEAFLDLSSANEISDGRARCISVALCDEEGRPTRVFYQGQSAHFFYEFEILGEIGIPAGGLEFCDFTGRVVHGKNTFQYGTPTPYPIQPGRRLRYHHCLRLEISPGEYMFTIGLASTDMESYLAYQEGRLGHEHFAQRVYEHCRVINAGSFTVRLDPTGRLLHHGVVNLPGDCRMTVAEPEMQKSPPLVPRNDAVKMGPTIFHITHWKAGSQWIYKILRDCAPEHIVPPQLGESQFLHWPLLEGRVYPTVYVTKQQFDSVRLPANWRRFVVIRDLRDTLVSAYFSIKVSHPILESRMAYWRGILHSLSLEEGLIYLMDEWLPYCARIQLSWLEAGERLIRYEDLLEHDLDILEQVLINECQLAVPPEKLRAAILANRFEQLTKGRPRAQEDVTAHERKGIAGDWRNYFTERVKRAFKARYGGLLIATGYEMDLNW